MKIFNKYIVLTLLAGLITLSCEDEELKQKNFPGWETAVNGFVQFETGSAESFVYQQTNVDLDLMFRWISIDQGVEVSKIEFFINFQESYTNPDGDPAVADHGIELFQTVDSPAGNREDITLSISQADVYTLFQNATFDYDEDDNTAETPVFNNPDKPDRDPNSSPFIDGDSFTLSWILTAADGRVFDSWSPSVCTELPGSNCQLGWQVICVSDIEGNYDAESNGTEYYGSSFSYTYTESFSTTDSDGNELASGKYEIADLSGGMEPNIWGNPEVKAVVIDACGKIFLDESSFSYLYGYSILSGSEIDPNTGIITIRWENVYGENGVNVYTPQ